MTYPRVPFLVGWGPSENVKPVSATDPMPVSYSATANNLPTTPIAGQGTVGQAAVQLPSAAMKYGVTFSVEAENSGSIYVGTSGSVSAANGVKLNPGDLRFLATDNLNRWWVIGTAAGQKYNYIGS